MSSEEDERYGERYFTQRIFRCSPVKRLISFPLECRGSVQLEVEEEAGAAVTRGLHPSDVVETVANSFESTLAAIKPAAIAVASNFRSIADAPEGVEVEFGVKFAGQA